MAAVCWVVTDRKIGSENQCVGLAEALGFAPIVKRVVARPPWRWLPPALWPRPLAGLAATGDPLEPPWPDLLIACGRVTVAPAMAVRRASGGRAVAVQIHRPGVDPRAFDLVIVPRHDRLSGANVVVTEGSLHRVTPARLAAAAERFAPRYAGLPRPFAAVLIGGSNRAFRLSATEMAGIADALVRLARERGVGLAVTMSRRTDPAAAALLRERLRGLPADIWDGAGDNPYFGMLALADAILVTADSVNMVSEAASTGKPVHVIELPGRSAKFARFHDALRATGATRPFRGELEQWSYRPLADVARAAQAVRERFGARLGLPAQSAPMNG